MQSKTAGVVRFAEYALDLRTGELHRNHLQLKLQPQPAKVLVLLVRRAGELLTRQEIAKQVWDSDVFVDYEQGLNFAIRQIRAVLEDDPDHPQFLETIPKRGYRFVAPVEEVTHVEVPLQPKLSVETGLQPGQSVGASLVGKKVSHYRVLEIIGGGGMGLVYKAEDLKLGRRVALKFLPEELARDSISLQRFEREAHTASTLNHRNICTIYEVEEHDGQPCLVMELLEGETLRDRLAAWQTKPIPVDEMLQIAIQICDGLQAAHQSNIIHRDIKPANIFLTTAGQVKILDFGLARFMAGESEAVNTNAPDNDLERAYGASASAGQAGSVAHTLTRTGSAMGTAGYMSPEQVRGEQLDARTDIFSFGLVLYEMAAGQRAFSGETAAVVHDSIVHNSPVPLRELNSTLPARLVATIDKCLEKERERRYQSASELRRALEDVKRGAENEASGRFLAAWRSGRSLQIGIMLGLGGTVLLLVLLGFLPPKFWWRRTVTSGELRHQELSKELAERQLTANPLDDNVGGAAISPDGKYVAYQDQTGFYLRSIDSGETRPIPLPAELSNRIDHLCWFPGGEKLLADVEGSNGELDTWVIAMLGGAEPHLLYRHGAATGISPDGRMIAFTSGELAREWKEVWVGGANGEAPRKLVTAEEQEQLTSPVWSPDGRWIAYGRIWKTAQGSRSSDIKVRPADGGPAKTLVAESSLSESNTLTLGANAWFVGSWSPDWRLMFTVAEGPASRSAQTKYSLWQVRVDPRTGEAAGKPGQVTQWSEFVPRDLTITADGKHLALLKERLWFDVYLGDLSPNGANMKTPRRLTLDDRGSDASAWTRDGKAILFGSSRNGRQEIFKQGLAENVAEMVVSAPGDVYGGKMSPDGAWFLYWQYESAHPAVGTSVDWVRLMRRAVGGGSPEMVLQVILDPYGLDDFSCSQNPRASSPCVLGLLEDKDLIFYSVDPLRGKGSRLGKIPVFGAYMGWDLSSDGSRIAVVDGDKYEGRIEVLTLSDGSWHEVAREPGGRHLQSIAWAADGKSFFATAYAPNSYNLLHVTLAGNVRSLLHNDARQWLVSPLPSPDGKYLAFRAQNVGQQCMDDRQLLIDEAIGDRSRRYRQRQSSVMPVLSANRKL